MSTLLILFFVVLALNVLPAFAPPTWMVFSFLGFRLPSHMGCTFALVGAAAATMGRFLLGKLSRRIVRNKWLSDATRENINSIKVELERRPKMTFAVLLFYAFTPLPSNYLFIAYGLTALPFIYRKPQLRTWSKSNNLRSGRRKQETTLDWILEGWN